MHNRKHKGRKLQYSPDQNGGALRPRRLRVARGRQSALAVTTAHPWLRRSDILANRRLFQFINSRISVLASRIVTSHAPARHSPNGGGATVSGWFANALCVCLCSVTRLRTRVVCRWWERFLIFFVIFRSVLGFVF